MKTKKDHVLIDETIIMDIISYFESKNYKDYDIGDCVIKHEISYFNNINPLTEPFAFSEQINNEVGADGSKIYNLWLIHKYQDLLHIYQDFKQDIYDKSDYLKQFDYVDVLNYALYRLNVNDICAISLNLLGIKKKEIV